MSEFFFVETWTLKPKMTETMHKVAGGKRGGGGGNY